MHAVAVALFMIPMQQTEPPQPILLEWVFTPQGDLSTLCATRFSVEIHAAHFKIHRYKLGEGYTDFMYYFWNFLWVIPVVILKYSFPIFMYVWLEDPCHNHPLKNINLTMEGFHNHVNCDTKLTLNLPSLLSPNHRPDLSLWFESSNHQRFPKSLFSLPRSDISHKYSAKKPTIGWC